MTPPSDPGLVRAFAGWAGTGRLLRGLMLIVAGALIEGLGVLMLIPAISIILAPETLSGTGLVAGLRGMTGDGPPAQQLGIVLGIFAALIPLRFAILYRRDVVLTDMAQGFIAALRLRFFRAIASVPWVEAARLGHGRIGHALSRDLDRASAAVGAVLSGTSTALVLAGQLVIAIWLSPAVALGVLVLAVGVLVALGPVRRRAARIGRETTLADYQLFTTTAGFLRGLKAAKAHGLEGAYLEGFSQASRGFAGRLIDSQRNASVGRLTMQSAVALLAVSGILVGHQWLGFPPDVLIVVLLILVRLTAPLQAVQSALQSYRLGREAYRSALAQTVGKTSAATPAMITNADPWPSSPGFNLNNISFRPEPDAAPILSDFTGAIPPGRITAVAGPSGAGKTTLLDLATGLHAPDAGEILIDEMPFDDVARGRLRPVLAYVGQEGAPVAETLRDHLTWGCASLDDAALWTALDAVGARDLVSGSEAGLDTPMREAGAHYSGGERQRLRLANAILRRPRFLVLDEATNALDIAAEDAVLRAVFAACDGATILMVSHRPDTLRLADHVLRLDPPEMRPPVRPSSPPSGGSGGVG